MNRRKALKLLLLGSASVTSLISYKWLDQIRSADVAYLKDKQSLIAELAEAIIPETDTPGAKAVRVDAFILRMLSDCTDSRTLSNFIIGLQELEEFTLLRFKRPFFNCNQDQKETILQEFEARSAFYGGLLGKVEVKLMGKPFFTTLKYYTVLGFCTSQLGATKALQYDCIPGSYENISLIGPGQKAWATK